MRIGLVVGRLGLRSVKKFIVKIEVRVGDLVVEMWGRELKVRLMLRIRGWGRIVDY